MTCIRRVYAEFAKFEALTAVSPMI